MKKASVVLLGFALFLSFFSNSVSAAVPSSAAIDVLNAASLNPQKTGYIDMDNKVEALLTEFRKSSTDTYSLVKACYDYLILNTSLREDRQGNMMIQGYTKNDRDPSYNSLIPQDIVFLAAGALYDGRGICHEYSAAFIVMTRAIGLESYFYTGQAAAEGGGYMGHAWAEININGDYYIFDPNLEARVIAAKGGDIRYNYFCKTEEEMKKEYIWDWEDIERQKKEFSLKNAHEPSPLLSGFTYKYNINPVGVKKAATRNGLEILNSVHIKYNGKNYNGLPVLKTELPMEVYYFAEEFISQVEIDAEKDEIVITFDKEAGIVGIQIGKRGG